jgi:hypothetical protein
MSATAVPEQIFKMKSILAYTQGTCYAAILLMSGCTASGPQYSLPSQSVAQRPAAAAPFLAAGETVYRSTPLPDNWWQLYDEPVMNALIQEALNANADLKVAAANLARTRCRKRNCGCDNTHYRSQRCTICRASFCSGKRFTKCPAG